VVRKKGGVSKWVGMISCIQISSTLIMYCRIRPGRCDAVAGAGLFAGWTSRKTRIVKADNLPREAVSD
jgi:hypothetical protein